VITAKAGDHHKITAKDTKTIQAFITQAQDLNLFDSVLTKEAFQKLVLDKTVSEFQQNKPILLIGKTDLSQYKDVKKSILMNSKKSMPASMQCLWAYLKKDAALLKGLDQKNEAIKQLADILTGDKLEKLNKALQIIVPEIKPIIETVLSQIADEEETVLIAG
jgi:hypothetical protein